VEVGVGGKLLTTQASVFLFGCSGAHEKTLRELPAGARIWLVGGRARLVDSPATGIGRLRNWPLI
jgi:hypothetical protein